MRILILFAALLSTACSSVVYLPVSSRQTPAVSGRLWGGKVGYDFATTVPVTIINNIRTTPPTRNEIIVGEDSNLVSNTILGLLFGSGIDVALGLHPNVDLYYTSNPGLRVLLFGDRTAGWLGTGFLGYFSNSSGFESDGARADVLRTGAEWGISVGNRIKENQMFYFTFANRGGTAVVSVKPSGGSTYKYDDSFDHYILSAGFILGKAWNFKGEASWSSVTWRGRSDTLDRNLTATGSNFGGVLGFGFNW